MKKIIIGSIALAIFTTLMGCSAGARQLRQNYPVEPLGFKSLTAGHLAGMVPVDFENAAGPYPVQVLLFEGAAMVTLVPDVRTGGWQYSRPAFCHFSIRPSLDSNWREYVRLYLPRNSNFVVVARAENFWGAGKPYFTSFRTGADPFSQTYTSVTPTAYQVVCGAFVQLRPEAISLGDRLNLQITIDTRQWGRAITNSIVEWLWR